MDTPVPIWFWQLSFFPISILCSLWLSHPDLSKVNWKHLAASIMTSITCHSPHLYHYFLWQLNTGRITWMQKMEGALNNLYIQELTLPKPVLACLQTQLWTKLFLVVNWPWTHLSFLMNNWPHSSLGKATATFWQTLERTRWIFPF